MTDRELLELAAKAAGIVQTGYVSEGQYHPAALLSNNEDYCSVRWNPLIDDGDALRLAVALRLEIKFLDGFKQVCCRRSDDRDNFEMHGLVGYGEGADLWVSAENVRRAIVRAAAEIGKQK